MEFELLITSIILQALTILIGILILLNLKNIFRTIRFLRRDLGSFSKTQKLCPVCRKPEELHTLKEAREHRLI